MDVPTTGLQAFITDLAKKHGVKYVKTSTGTLADTITNLSDDDVAMDRVECRESFAGGRGATTLTDEATPPRVRQAKDSLHYG